MSTDKRSPNHHRNRNRVSVVYYLCRNRQLEHPHFVQVPLSSPDGLYLRDVIQRLNVLRGRGMASMYSWSSKRSYKSGFVWQDLSEDDLILPAHGNEYVLKGSELLLADSNPDRAALVTIIQNPKQSPDRAQLDSLRPTEYKVCKGDGVANASTQTDENSSIATKPGETSARADQMGRISEYSPSKSCRKTGTLESLIRADADKINNTFLILEEEGAIRSNPRLKATNVLMQLVSCGSVSVKDHSFGHVPTYRPRFSHSNYYGSPLFSNSILSEDSSRLTSFRSSEQDDALSLRRSSSKPSDNVIEIEESLLQELGL